MVGFLEKLRTVLPGLLILGAAACGPSESDPAAKDTGGCSAKAAQIGVGAGRLFIFCGCQEAAGTEARPPAVLTCTVPARTTVFFRYLATGATHQIVSTGQPSFEPSPPSQSSLVGAANLFTVEFDQAGTYTFKDAYFESLQGQIVVQ